MSFNAELKVRTYECDANGHVNNAVYLHYLEYARGAFLEDVGFDYKKMMEAGFGLYVTRVEIDYKAPAFANDVLTIRSMPIKKGAASGVMRQEIYRGEELLIKATVTWAFVDRSGKPTRIPPEWDLPGLRPLLIPV